MYGYPVEKRKEESVQVCACVCHCEGGEGSEKKWEKKEELKKKTLWKCE